MFQLLVFQHRCGGQLLEILRIFCEKKISNNKKKVFIEILSKYFLFMYFYYFFKEEKHRYKIDLKFFNSDLSKKESLKCKLLGFSHPIFVFRKFPFVTIIWRKLPILKMCIQIANYRNCQPHLRDCTNITLSFFL